MTAVHSTELPDGWSKVRLTDLGYFYSGLTGKTAADFGTGSAQYIPFLNVIGSVELKSDWTDLVCIDPAELQNDVRNGDLLFNGSSETPDEVAFACAVTDVSDVLYLNSFCFGFRFTLSDELDPLFFAFLSRSPSGRQVIAPLAQGSTRYNIAKTLLAKVEFAVPPVAEQRAIAAALSDASAWVESLDALIAKKRDLKTSAFQHLYADWALWAPARLSDLVSRTSGAWGNTESFEGAVRCNVIRAGDISPEGQLMSSARRYLSAAEWAKSELIRDDLVITASGSLGKTWLCDDRSSMAASNFVRRLRPDKTRVVPAFILHVLLSDIGRQHLNNHTATSAYPNLMPSFFEEDWFRIPNLETQAQVAVTLTDMDAEIDALIGQRDKAELIRQGMAQNLLTGKVRLV